MRARLGAAAHFCEVVVLKGCLPLMQGFEEELVVQGMHMLFTGDKGKAAAERRGNNLKGLKDFYLKAKARIWP